MSNLANSAKPAPLLELLTTFYVGNDLYGIEVMRVQEVTGTPTVIPVPLAPKFVRGLINLRGQLATAFGLKELFNIAPGQVSNEMSVVCRIEGNLVSLIVDSIDEVVEVDVRTHESPPETIPMEIRQFLKGIYKLNGSLLSVLDLDKLSTILSPTHDANESRPQQKTN